MAKTIKLIDARKAKGLERKHVAELLNIAPNTLGQKENGYRRFHMDEIAFLCDLYGVKQKDVYECQILKN